MYAVVGTSERLRRRVYQVTGLQEVFNDSNVQVLLKSSPEKCRLSLSPIAEKAGPVVKLNDSGSWRRRFALVVPHTFLYYFVQGPNDQRYSAELRPHGVIDLELYTDVTVLDGNVLRLAPADDTLPIRTFFFRLPNKAEAEEWANVIRNTRYSQVREERDALLAAKAVLTEQAEILSNDLRCSRIEVEASQRREAAALSELARYDANNARRVEQVQALLAAAACGNADGEDRPRNGQGAGGAAAAELSALVALGETIADCARETADLKAKNATVRQEATAAAELHRHDAAAALHLLQEERKRTAEEAAARHTAEEELVLLRRELQESRANTEEARANLGVVAAACREAEAKARELQEHRRVLAREVKASRAENRRLSAALTCATTAAAAAAATVEISRNAGGSNPMVGARVNALCSDGEEIMIDRGGGGGSDRDGGGEDVGHAAPKTVVREDGDGMNILENCVDAGVRVDPHKTDDKNHIAGCRARGGGGGSNGPVPEGDNQDCVVLSCGVGNVGKDKDDCVHDRHMGESGEGGNECGIRIAASGGFHACTDANDLSSKHEYTSKRSCSSTDNFTMLGVDQVSPPQRQTLTCLNRSSSEASCNGEYAKRARADTRVTSPDASSSSAYDGTASGLCNGGEGRRILPWEEPYGKPAAAQHGEAAEIFEANSGDAFSNNPGEAPTEGTCEGDEGVAATPPHHTECTIRSGGENERMVGGPKGSTGTGPGASNGDHGALGSPLVSSSTTAASPGGESRFDVIVQSFSSGLRESRRVRRRPLLGSLDDTIDCDEFNDNDGDGVTDGADGESHHDPGRAEEGLLKRTSVVGASMTDFSPGNFDDLAGTEKESRRQQLNEGLRKDTEESCQKPVAHMKECSDGAAIDRDTLAPATDQRIDPPPDSGTLCVKDTHGVPFVISAFPGASPPSAPATTTIAAAGGNSSDFDTCAATTVGSMLTRVVAKVRQQAAGTSVGGDGDAQLLLTSNVGSRSSTVPLDDDAFPSATTSSVVAAGTGTGTSSDGSWKIVLGSSTSTSSSVAAAAAGDDDKSPTNWIRTVARQGGEELQMSCSTDDNGGTPGASACPVSSSVTCALPSAVSSTPRPEITSENTTYGASACASDTPAAAVAGKADGATTNAAALMAAAAERGSWASLEAAAAARRWEAKLKGSFISMAGGVRWGMAPSSRSVSSPSNGNEDD